MVKCHDCERVYGEPGFPDLVVPHEVWNAISPTGDEGGLLCPSCLCARAELAGVECVAEFRSGPFANHIRDDKGRLRAAEIDVDTLHRWALAMADWDAGGEKSLAEIEQAIEHRDAWNDMAKMSVHFRNPEA